MFRVYSASLLVFASVAVLCNTVSAQQSIESSLRRAIFHDYDKLVRPVTDFSHKIPLKVELVPTFIKDVDVKDRYVKFHAWLAMDWADELLTWNPDDFGGIYALRVPSSEVWKPDISFYMAPTDYFFNAVHTNVMLFANGSVVWVPPVTVKSYCAPNASAPDTGDTFHCGVKLGSWTYDATQIYLEVRHDDLAQDIQEDGFNNIHPKWKLESFSGHVHEKKYKCCEEPYPTIVYDMVFKRKPQASSSQED